MEKEKIVKYAVEQSKNQGADFSEAFYEESLIRSFYYIDQKLDKVESKIVNGLGIRIEKDGVVYYADTNDLSLDNINSIIYNLTVTFSNLEQKNQIDFQKIKSYKANVKKEHNTISSDEKKRILSKINNIARNRNSKISQVEIQLYESDQEVMIANSEGVLVKDKRVLTGLLVVLVAKENDKMVKSYETYRVSGGYELFDDLCLENKIIELTDATILKLSAKPCPGGEMPVVIGPAFGSVIFHEACGHALEATTVAKGISVLSNKIGDRIGTDKLTIIDDGTLPGVWGTVNVDDEGTRTQKNILIDNGILKSYLVDKLNSKKMNHPITGSGRRENYHYAPTSRMNNTYLVSGNDSIEDMIKSIDLGLYAKRMNGGSVNPITGDFNFGVSEGYMIRNGEIAEPVENASLIGNTIDILMQIEMVSDDFSFGTGWCGSESGSVPVGNGQPTIKVSKILVGGKN